MAHVITTDGRDLGEVTDPDLLAYYQAEGYQIGPSAAVPAAPAVPVAVPNFGARVQAPGPAVPAVPQSAETDSDDTEEGDK